jgi:hypothetical protein
MCGVILYGGQKKRVVGAHTSNCPTSDLPEDAAANKNS